MGLTVEIIERCPTILIKIVDHTGDQVTAGVNDTGAGPLDPNISPIFQTKKK